MVSAGAAVIIFAAWAKSHSPILCRYHGYRLVCGQKLLSFWYMQLLNGLNQKSHEEDEPAEEVEPVGNPALKTMDKMLKEADITPANLKKLGEDFQKLGTTVSRIC